MIECKIFVAEHLTSEAVSQVKIDEQLLDEVEKQIKAINESIVSGSEELAFLKKELQNLKNTLSTATIIELNPVNKKIRDVHRGININLQDATSESFPLDYHGMGTRSWATLLTYGAFISWQYKKLGKRVSPITQSLRLRSLKRTFTLTLSVRSTDSCQKWRGRK